MKSPIVLDAHHDGSETYISNPNPDLGETVTVFMRVPLAADVQSVVLRHLHDGGANWTEAQLDRASDTEQWWKVEIVAHNPITSYRFHLTDRARKSAWLNGEGIHRWDVTDVSDFRISTQHEPPEWVHKTVWYQIFPDRFARPTSGELDAPLPTWAWRSEWDDLLSTELPDAMTQIYGGSLRGITAQLDYLSELGVTGLYLCPFFPGRSNHRYDAATFDEVDPLLGGNDGLRELVELANQRAIRIMADLTTNHSGAQHEWFRSALNDETSPTRTFYSWRDDGSYECWLDLPSLPKFNHTSQSLRRALYEGPDSVAGRLIGEEFGLAALRIDVANMTGRLGDVDLNRTCAQGLRETIRQVQPKAWLMGEYTGDASADLDGGGWHGVMNYSGFTRPAWGWLRRHDIAVQSPGEPGPMPRRSGYDTARSARAFLARIPYSVALTNMNLLGSHDSPRWAHAAGSPSRNAVGAAMLYTWPGSPLVFYGDEIGLGGDASWDVTARIPFPWHDRGSWDTDLLDTYRSLIRLRSTSTALAVGGMRWVSIGDDHLVYLRESRAQRLLVHLARCDHQPLAISLADLAATEVQRLAGAPVTVRRDKILLDTSGPTWRILELEEER